ncbi:MAG: hypothetical protein ACNA8W_13155 [Bradymonadaceae bacterium]
MDQENKNEAVEIPTTGAPKKITLIFMALLLAIPALIPLKFALEEEPGTLMYALFAFSIGLLVVNAGLLYVIYRWSVSTTKSESSNSSRKANDHGGKKEG